MNDNDILTMFMYNKALLDEIRTLYHERSYTHQERSLNIGDVVVAAMNKVCEEKLKEHQDNLVRKLVPAGAPRSMLGQFHGRRPNNG